MDKFQNKYRIPSARWQHWNYGWNAPYFVTICTQNREWFFGNIVETQFIASVLGNIAQKKWLEIPHHFPFVKLDAFVVMPNHVHGIIVIDKPNDGDNDGCDGERNGNCKCDGVCRDAINRVSTVMETNNMGGFAGNKNPMLNNNLSRIIRWYKGRVSFESRKIHANFAWQSRFHDHIIRNDKSYQTISEYIINNPLKWKGDKFNPDKKEG